MTVQLIALLLVSHVLCDFFPAVVLDQNLARGTGPTENLASTQNKIQYQQQYSNSQCVHLVDAASGPDSFFFI